ncbi:hypothetical protein H4R33_005638 [Dimargaris cristalligena]|uniref:Pheromone/general odorant binding protein n=1 Tax=Dimargaris cristalligena TaxID=215637 RepID=A0A4P9ZTY6_9FUNG|nr:hypothetical protein H4R33_005638 [Dimargaris cristalligena]RKP37056.1 hypothetical protein BJ085DRAFT_37934 [Dimargaris cristalligena]|eukprot:RKP37056.1 hypothetical protein BJ085DRAFT_37934 [Dimargaris cristalligena]
MKTFTALALLLIATPAILALPTPNGKHHDDEVKEEVKVVAPPSDDELTAIENCKNDQGKSHFFSSVTGALAEAFKGTNTRELGSDACRILLRKAEQEQA